MRSRPREPRHRSIGPGSPRANNAAVPAAPGSPSVTKSGSTVKDLDNFSELSQHGINTTKKINTIMLPSGKVHGTAGQSDAPQCLAVPGPALPRRIFLAGRITTRIACEYSVLNEVSTMMAV